MPVFNNALAGAAGSGGDAGYKIQRSLRFNPSDTSYLTKTFSSAGNRKTYTFSCWVKIGSIGAEKNLLYADNTWFRFENTDHIYFWHTNGNLYTDAKFRDTNAWYHVILAVDTTQGTASNRVKIYVNGVNQVLNGSGYPNQNALGGHNNAAAHNVGRQHTNNNLFNGYMAEVHFVDGQQLAATDFGEFDADTGVWNPIEFTGNHGNNGFYLDFSDNSSNSALGNDAAGNNDFTVNNFSAADGAPVTIGSASGALPIHNTSDSFGVTKSSGFRTDAYASNLVLALPFDSIAATGQASDVHATIKGSGSNKVSYHNIATTTTQSKYYGNAAYFDGSQGDNVTHATSTDFEFGTGDWTVEGWFRPDHTNNDRYLVSWTTPSSSNGGPTAGHAGINIYNGNWRIGGFNGQLYNGNEGLAANTWVHIAMAREGNALRIFINGKLVASKACSGIDFDSTSGMTLGRYAALPVITMTAT